MLKNILNLKGAQQLNKNEQSEINGGKSAPDCPAQIGCAGLSSGDTCWASGTSCAPACPGVCGNSGGFFHCDPR